MDTLPLGPGIVCLRRNVGRPEALREFGGGGLLSRLAYGPLRRLVDIYIPYRLYRVEILDQGARQQRYLALDAVRASFDLYSFPGPLRAEELEPIETRNHPPPAVSRERSRAEILDRARRLAYEKGLLRIKDLSLSAELVLPEFHVPYWAGFFGRGERASRVRVLDAVRRRQEGAKLCAFVSEWLAG